MGSSGQGLRRPRMRSQPSSHTSFQQRQLLLENPSKCIPSSYPSLTKTWASIKVQFIHSSSRGQSIYSLYFPNLPLNGLLFSGFSKSCPLGWFCFSEAVVLSQGQFCPLPGDILLSLETYAFVSFSGQRLSVLPNILQCTEQPCTMRNYPAQNVSCAETRKHCSKVRTLRTERMPLTPLIPTWPRRVLDLSKRLLTDRLALWSHPFLKHLFTQ